VDCSDFEPVAKADLLAALLCRLLRGASDLDSAQSQPSSSTWPVASPTNTPTPAKSFKEAVASPARSSDCNKFETRRSTSPGLCKVCSAGLQSRIQTAGLSSRSRNTSKGLENWTESLRLWTEKEGSSI